MSLPEITPTETGYRFGDLEILFGDGGKGRLLRANSLVLHGPRRIVVDAAAQESRQAEIARENPVLFFTHYHADHRAAEHCYPMTTEIWAPEADARAIEDSGDFVRRVDQGDSKISKRMFEALRMIFKISDRPVARRINGGERLDMGGLVAETVHLPGHTPGHMGLFFPELSFLFLTDIDLTPFGPWYGNDVSDIDQFKASIQKARDFECTWYFTSHGESIIDRERFLYKLMRYEEHFEHRDQKLLGALEEGEKSFDELSRIGIVYKPRKLAAMENLVYFERKHVRMHLEKLIERGLVRADESFQHFQLA